MISSTSTMSTSGVTLIDVIISSSLPLPPPPPATSGLGRCFGGRILRGLARSRAARRVAALAALEEAQHVVPERLAARHARLDRALEGVEEGDRGQRDED